MQWVLSCLVLSSQDQSGKLVVSSTGLSSCMCWSKNQRTQWTTMITAILWDSGPHEIYAARELCSFGIAATTAGHRSMNLCASRGSPERRRNSDSQLPPLLRLLQRLATDTGRCESRLLLEKFRNPLAEIVDDDRYSR